MSEALVVQTSFPTYAPLSSISRSTLFSPVASISVIVYDRIKETHSACMQTVCRKPVWVKNQVIWPTPIFEECIKAAGQEGQLENISRGHWIFLLRLQCRNNRPHELIFLFGKFWGRKIEDGNSRTGSATGQVSLDQILKYTRKRIDDTCIFISTRDRDHLMSN